MEIDASNIEQGEIVDYSQYFELGYTAYLNDIQMTVNILSASFYCKSKTALIVNLKKGRTFFYIRRM